MPSTLPEFASPADLAPFEVLFDKSEPNAALPAELLSFAGNLGFPGAKAPEGIPSGMSAQIVPDERPWVYSNFVQSLDGMVTFGGARPEGRWVAQSRHDRWMMDLLRAHADAVLYGASSLIQETLYSGIPGGPVFRITDPSLLCLRQERLQRGKQKNIIVTGSGKLCLSEYRLFRSEERDPNVEAWVVTTKEGRGRLGDTGNIPVTVFGESGSVDLEAMLRWLRKDHAIRYLLCEGGPTLNGYMVRGGWMDEKFLTIAPQEIGPEASEADSASSNRFRLTTISGPGFSVETARWYRWISCRKAGDHEFNRYRFTSRAR